MEPFTEKKIGETFIYGGQMLQCVESKLGACCDGCFFQQEQGDQWINDCVNEHKCHLLNRKDKKVVIFVKLDVLTTITDPLRQKIQEVDEELT